ncbi:hypothetical protein DWX58_00880 [Pseudoflavonifractor sp. AF19-9AC]|nr:hypothetical protein DWX58_00880 [Pseudoflavonifractor sp. AF19-9AC]
MAFHGNGVGGNAPHGGIWQTEHLLIPQHLPDAAAVERPLLQTPLEFQAAAEGLSGQLPGQVVHPAVAQQDNPRRAEEQQPRVQGINGLLDGDRGDLSIELPPTQQADMCAAYEKIKKSGQEKEGEDRSGDCLCQRVEHHRRANDKKRPDQLRPHGGSSAQYRAQQKDQLSGIAVSAGQQKAAVQSILHLPQKSGEEEQCRQDGALHTIFHPARPAGRQASDAVGDGQGLQHDAHRRNHDQ